MSTTTGQRHVALIVASMAMGGAERMTLNLAIEFAQRGHRVDLVLVNKRGPLLDRIPPEVRVVPLGAARARGGVRQLRHYFKAERPDAVLSVAFQTNILTMIASLGLRRKPRIILSVRNAYSASMAAIRQPTRMLFEIATRLLYPHADGIISISKGVGGDLHHHAGVPMRLITAVYNPVIDDRFDQLSAEPLELPPPRDPAAATIVTVGRLAKQKDHATLLRAFAHLARQHPARLILLGEGELREELEALAGSLGIAEKVLFAGIKNNPYPWMREADLFVFSSAWEGFGNVLVEAMATGTPVISTDCPHGPAEILEDGKWGRLVPVGNADLLAEAMRDVLNGGGVDARDRAKDFTVERAADAYLGVLLHRG